MKLSKTQREYLNGVRECGFILIGRNTLFNVRTLDALVRRGLLAREPIDGWTRYRLA